MAGTTAISAQGDPRVTRADASATLGWLAVNTGSDRTRPDDDWASSLFGALSAGWYETDNLKTELDLGAGTKASTYRTDSIAIDTRQGYATTITTFSRRTLSLSQQYQFFHNALFHPYLAAGANVTWERATARTNPIVVFDSRGTQVLAPEQVRGPATTVRVRPFVATGFKAYFSPRAFFRSDFRMAVRGGLDETVLRFGFGVDF